MVFIKPFLGAAAIFSVAFAAPSRYVKRGSESEKSPSKYEDSYESNKYESGKSESNKGYEGSYNEENKNYEYKDNMYTEPERSHETSTAYRENTHTPEKQTEKSHETSTSSAEQSYPTYGSGSSNWDSEGYDDCVSKCLATYGDKDTWYKPTATQESEGSKGTGATHTVVVAPTQGVLRYIPFAVNASVGDTIKFMWGANTHTVTKGSELLPCNKSGDSLFTSGSKDKDFVFTQVVNTTDPTYFFCNTPGHCQKGMFGIINPPVEAGAPTTTSFMMQDLQKANPDLKAYAAVVDKNTEGNDFARSWGGDIAIGKLPQWAHELAAANIMYTRSVLAANPDIVKDGSIDMGSISSTPMMIPNDVSVELANAAASGSSPSAPATGAPSSPTDSTPPPAESPVGATGNNNSASSLGSPRVLVAVMVVVATFLSL